MKRTLWFAMLILFGCDLKGHDVKSSEVKALSTPEVARMVEKFKRQESQLEMNGCEFLSNGKQFFLGMNVRELIGVLGEYDYFNRGYYVWEDHGVVLVDKITEKENLDERMSILKVYLHSDLDPRDLEDLRHELATKKDVFLFDGIPLDSASSIQSLIERSVYEYDDFGISDRGYSIVKECGDPARKVRYFFSSEGGWNYGGGGHLKFKTEINRKNENLIRYVAVEYQ